MAGINENKVITGTGFLGALSGGSVKIGDVFRRDKDDLNYYESILDDILRKRGLDQIPEEWITKGNPMDMKFISETGVNIDASGAGSSGTANGKLKLSFSKSNTAFVYLKNAVTYRLALGEIRTEILDVWDEKGYDKKPAKFVLVNEIVQASSGTLIYTAKKNNGIELEGSSPNVPLLDIEPAIEGKVKISTGGSNYRELISEVEFVPLFGAVKVSRRDQFKAVD